MTTMMHQAGSSSYTTAYHVLLKAQRAVTDRLDISRAQAYLEGTPELCFPPGTTIRKVLERLQAWELIELEGDSVNVLPNHSRKAK